MKDLMHKAQRKRATVYKLRRPSRLRKVKQGGSLRPDLFSVDFRAAAPVVIRFGIYDFAPVEVAAVQRVYQHLRSCDICCDGNVMHVAEAEQVVFRFAEIRGRDRGTEIKEHIDLIEGNARRNLLFSALFAREQALNGKTGSLAYVFCRRARCTEGVL